VQQFRQTVQQMSEDDGDEKVRSKERNDDVAVGGMVSHNLSQLARSST
jgi:hypothetical protein